MNIFATIILVYSAAGNAPAHSELYVAGPFTDQVCQARIADVKASTEFHADKVLADCIPESDLPKLAELAKQHECAFIEREDLGDGVSLAAFNCSK